MITVTFKDTGDTVHAETIKDLNDTLESNYRPFMQKLMDAYLEKWMSVEMDMWEHYIPIPHRATSKYPFAKPMPSEAYWSYVNTQAHITFLRWNSAELLRIMGPEYAEIKILLPGAQ